MDGEKHEFMHINREAEVLESKDSERQCGPGTEGETP